MTEAPPRPDPEIADVVPLPELCATGCSHARHGMRCHCGCASSWTPSGD
jgi:hypothetical protein